MKLDANKKKRYIAYGLLMWIMAFGILGIGIKNKESGIEKASSSVIVNDTALEEDIENHDGDVLVDSLALFPADKSTENMQDKEISGTITVTSDENTDLLEGDAYFDEARATVNMDRNQIISMLTEVIAETKSETEKENAAEQKLKLIGYMEKENVVESLLKTKGFSDTFVLITDNAVNVTVKTDNLSQSDVAKICDIVMRETGRSADEIVIQSK